MIYKISPNPSLLKRGREKTAGFTLIEVLTAVAILGIGVVILLQLFSGGLRLEKISGEYGRAVRYGREKLEEIVLMPALEEGTETGNFDETYRWQTEITKEDLHPEENSSALNTPPFLFYRIQITVLWKSGAGERSFRIDSYREIKPKNVNKTG